MDTDSRNLNMNYELMRRGQDPEILQAYKTYRTQVEALGAKEVFTYPQFIMSGAYKNYTEGLGKPLKKKKKPAIMAEKKEKGKGLLDRAKDMLGVYGDYGQRTVNPQDEWEEVDGY